MKRPTPSNLTVIENKDLDQRPPEFSDDALALQFANKHHEDRLYVAKWATWLAWDGRRWAPDDTLKIFDDARAINRAAAASCKDAKLSKTIASAAAVAAVERLARADRRLAARASQFDADPWQLNTPGGLIDLRTNECRPAQRDDYVTKMTRATAGGQCPRWMQFLAQITQGDLELQSFLARAVGYSLTGSTREHAFFFLFGTGGNGKSVFVETITKLLADYAVAAPIEMFTATKFQSHTTDVAGLQGARMITASETDVGRSLAEARVKLLTGGEAISARRMRADNVTFTPQFKLWMGGNHKPRVSTNDEAIRRRLHLIPFNANIPPWHRDQKLPEKLEAEWSGILQWAIDGCQQWQQIGLQPPSSVRDATDDYLSSEDAILCWLQSEAVFEANARSTTEELFASWKEYATRTNEDIGSQKDFVKALRGKQLELEHTREGNRWSKIRIRRKLQ
jgi:putative DNA primase/helicase